MEGVLQLGTQLTLRGHLMDVLTLDDPNEEFVAAFPGRIYALGPSFGSYRFNAKLVPWLTNHAREYDAVFVNGLWQYHLFATWRALRRLHLPYYVYTHGMLDPWFKHKYRLKHLKKWLYWLCAEYRALRDARAVIFTSEEERVMARRSFWLYQARERVIMHGTTAPPTNKVELGALFMSVHPEIRNRRVLLFLGRIHEKKGCDLLIRAFAASFTEDSTLHLVMAGPNQTGWMEQLQSLALSLGIADRISWPGMLHGDMKWGAFYSAEAFILPSHQENFGIAVAEALACGVPVLISDKVNIWREIINDNAGFAESDTEEGTRRLLSRWLKLPNSARAEMGRAARASFDRRFTSAAMMTSVLALLEH